MQIFSCFMTTMHILTVQEYFLCKPSIIVRRTMIKTFTQHGSKIFVYATRKENKTNREEGKTAFYKVCEKHKI